MDLPRFLNPRNDQNAHFFDQWPETQRIRPDGEVEFLQASFIRRWGARACIARNDLDELLEAAELIRKDASLSALAWHCHALLFGSEPAGRAKVANWPTQGRLGEIEGRFHILVLLSGLPSLDASYREKSIPETIVRDTLSDIPRWMEHNRRKNGAIGLGVNNLRWFLNHFRGSLFHLERLQFAPGPFWGKIRVYRHKTRRTVVALSEDDVRYRPDGRADGTGGVFAEDAYTASLKEDDTTVEGVPIRPTGYASLRPVVFDRDEWDLVMAPGDPTLHIHVPEGEPMDFERCGKSFEAALEFFPRYFPEKPFRAFCMGSWFLDPYFETLLTSRSNIVRFQREVYLFPIASNGRSVLERVFGHVPEDIRTCPQDTSLRRAIVRHLTSGGHFGGGGCFLFPEDLRWGEQVYRSRFPDVLNGLVSE